MSLGGRLKSAQPALVTLMQKRTDSSRDATSRKAQNLKGGEIWPLERRDLKVGPPRERGNQVRGGIDERLKLARLLLLQVGKEGEYIDCK